MKGIASNLNWAMSSLAITLAVGAVVYYERWNLEREIIQARQVVLALELQEEKLPSWEIFNSLCPQINRSRPTDNLCWEIYKKHENGNLVDLLAELMRGDVGILRWPKKSGSYVYWFRVLEGSKLESTELIDWLAQEAPTAALAAFNKIPAPCSGQQGQPLTIEADVVGKKDHYYLIITNAISVARQGREGDVCTVIGRMYVMPPLTLFRFGPSERDYLSLGETVKALARRRGLARSSWQESYESLTADYASRRVQIPLVGTDLEWTPALYVLSALSVGLLGWASYLLRALSRSEPEPGNMLGWLPLEVYNSKPVERIHRAAWSIELLVFGVFYVISLFAPIILTALHWRLGGVDNVLGRIVDLLLIVTASVLISSATVSYHRALRKRTSPSPSHIDQRKTAANQAPAPDC